MTIYTSRYYAKKEMQGSQAIVKVDNGKGGYGYVLMDYAAYFVWRKQK